MKIKNGIRFVYAQSEIILMIIEILITLHQMLSKKEFMKMLKITLKDQEKVPDAEKFFHLKLVDLLKNLGRIQLLYPKTKPIEPFIKQIAAKLKPLFAMMPLRFLEQKS